MFSQPASLELTHNWGTESDASFKGYHSGNDEPKGYGALQFYRKAQKKKVLLDSRVGNDMPVMQRVYIVHNIKQFLFNHCLPLLSCLDVFPVMPCIRNK